MAHINEPDSSRGRHLALIVGKRRNPDVTEEDIAIKLTVLEQEAKSAKHRLDDLEVQNAAIQDLALAVKELTLNMTRMNELQDQQRADIDHLKAEPGERWNTAKKTAFTSIISTIAGAAAVAIIMALAQIM